MGALATTGKKRRVRRRTGGGPGRCRSRKRYLAIESRESKVLALYGRLVSSTLAVRRERLSAHIKRIVAHVRQTKGWTLKKLLEEAKVDKPTYYRWVNGTWTGDLEPSPIERFHDAAGIPVIDAWMILWPGKYSRDTATAPLPTHPQYEALLRKLNDPSTSKEDAYLIVATFDMLMAKVGMEGKRAQ